MRYRTAILLSAAIVAAALALSLALAGSAHAGHPTVAVGPTLIDKPGYHSRFGYKPSGPHGSVPTLGHPHLPNACRIARGEYRLRHPFSKPRALRAFHGCKLWRLDHAYHSRLDALQSAAATARSPISKLIVSIELALLGHE